MASPTMPATSTTPGSSGSTQVRCCKYPRSEPDHLGGLPDDHLPPQATFRPVPRVMGGWWECPAAGASFRPDGAPGHLKVTRQPKSTDNQRPFQDEGERAG